MAESPEPAGGGCRFSTCYSERTHAAARLPPRLIDHPGARPWGAGEGPISDSGGVPIPLRHRSGFLPGRGLEDRTNVKCDSRSKLSPGKHVDRYHDQLGGREFEASCRRRFDQCHGKRRCGHRTSIACALALFALSGARVSSVSPSGRPVRIRRRARCFRFICPKFYAPASAFTISCVSLVGPDDLSNCPKRRVPACRALHAGPEG